MKRPSGPLIAVIVVPGIPLLLWFSVTVVRTIKKHNEAATEIRKIVRAFDDAIHYDERSMAYNEKWAPEDFFDTEEAINACNVISSGDPELLAELLRSGIDVNLTGKKGVTLLHWAFFDDKLDAFTQLLEAGTDPDKKLTGLIKRKRHYPIRFGDSILFSAMRIGKWDHFFSALKHTNDINQRDVMDKTLINASTGIVEISYLREDHLQRMIDAGVDLNSQDQHGGTAAMNTLNNRRPKLCLVLLKAGADTSIKNNRGNTISTRLPIVRSVVKRSVSDIPGSDERYLTDYDQLAQWLDENSKDAEPESKGQAP